jgi:hypothetical protein
MSRDLDDVSRAILRRLDVPHTAKEIAWRLQLSRRDATVRLSRMANSTSPAVEVVATRHEEGVDRPVPVYRAVVLPDALPPQPGAPGPLLAALNEAIRARKLRLADGV